MRKYLIYLILGLLFASCGGKINIENFDVEAWKNDPMGCKEERATLATFLIENKEELLGHNSHEIIEYLGDPDETELYNRNQKFYQYYISPGHLCGDEQHADKEHDRISLRFNATDALKEISIYN